MKVEITYYDSESLTVEEIVARVHQNFGTGANVEIGPDSKIAYDHVYFGLQQLITHEQVSLFHDPSGTYEKELPKLRARIQYKLEEILDQVIIDNESRIS